LTALLLPRLLLGMLLPHLLLLLQAVHPAAVAARSPG
jgi:hypothetical protein